MKKFLTLVFLLLTMTQTTVENLMGSNQTENLVHPGANGVIIAPNAVRIPIENILLVRKGSGVGAVRFTKLWTEKGGEDRFAEYESYYQENNTRNLSDKNVTFMKNKLSFPKPRGIGRLAFSFGNRDIQCGPIKLAWFGETWVYFFNADQDQGDYGIELAPTKWTDISQVNVFDPRIKWYRYDSNREEIIIPIYKLLENQDVSNKKQQ